MLLSYEVFPWLKRPWDDRIGSILTEWAETPYCAGGSAKGTGVDCVRFVASVLNELDGKRRKPLKKYPKDTAFHQPKTAIRAMKEFMRLYEPYEKVMTEGVESGDVFVVEPLGAQGPGHALIASPWNKMLIHAGRIEVEAIHPFNCGMIHAIYRPLFKEEWIK